MRIDVSGGNVHYDWQLVNYLFAECWFF